MKLNPYRFIPKGRYFMVNEDIKTQSDVRRERNVALIVLILMAAVVIGAPILSNVGKAVFGIPPVIY